MSKQTKTIIIRVDSGIITVIRLPKDTALEVRDYDIDYGDPEENQKIQTDKDGQSFKRTIINR